MTSISGLPLVADSALPADVRTGSTKDKNDYKAALGFEQMLVQRLVQSMAGSGDDGDDTDNPLTSGPYASTLQTPRSSKPYSR